MVSDSRPHPRVLLLDVNETLLDLAPVKQQIDELLEESGSSALWFATTLHYSLVMTVSGAHAGLTDIGAAALQMLARNRRIDLDDARARHVLGGMMTLRAHPDVAPALERLRAAGYRLGALTNSSQSGVEAQLQHAGLASYFERQLSVETPRLFKPHREVYLWAAREMGAASAECMLVAAHGWDVAGAKWAGLQTAFIGRRQQQRFALADPADIDVADFTALAEALGA